MTAQLDFLPGLKPCIAETVPPAQPHRPTSVAAAKAIRLKAESQAHRVLRFLAERGSRGATMLEMRDATGLAINAVCGRCGMARDASLIADSGQTRVNPGGHEAVVWVITRAGICEIERLNIAA